MKQWQRDFLLIFGGTATIIFLLTATFLRSEALQASGATHSGPLQPTVTPWANGAPPHQNGTSRFAAIGDYGYDSSSSELVAQMINGWEPDFIITLGDNNYDDGEAETIDDHVGRFFSNYIYPYQGSLGSTASQNRFFPALGNHDWHAENAQPYLDYFPISEAITAVPNNERYYDFVQGPVHFFVLDSDRREPDGNTLDSPQAAWLKQHLASSTTPWQIVYFHHAPYSSGVEHGSTLEMRWPFAEWGADAVLAAHNHVYERIQRDDIVYFVNGLGGRGPHELSEEAMPGTAFRYTGNAGAMLIEATSNKLQFAFYSVARGGTLLDSYTLTQD